MKTRRLDAALAIAMLLLVSSCAAAKNDTGSGGVASGPASPGATGAAGIYLGPLASPEVDTDAGIALAPPERLQPSVSWDAAYKTCATGESVCVAGVDPTISLALAIHELATNAVKHGALSRAEGHVFIHWSRESGDHPRLTLRWEERGGPAVSPPTGRGFGTRMIERGLAAELGGTVTIAFEPKGLVCTVDAPLPEGAE